MSPTSDAGAIDPRIFQAIIEACRKRRITLDDDSALESLARELSGRFRQKLDAELMRRVLRENPEEGG